MRVAAAFAALLLLSGCAWVQHEIAPAPAPALPVTPTAKPDAPKPPHRPRAVAGPTPAPVQAGASLPMPAAAPAAPPTDYTVRCRALAQNRADDAKQLGASAADQARMRSDTYRDCTQQSVK